VNEKQVVMMDSSEAATFRTVEGWVSRDGMFFGSDERTARYSGCTHRMCESCGAVVPKNYLKCTDCTAKIRTARYLAFPIVEWTGEYAMEFGADEYFADEDAALEYCEDNDIDPSALQLVATEPVYATEVDAEDYCSDDIPEDGELPAEIVDAFAVLNASIRACRVPLCWRRVNKRIVLKSPVPASGEGQQG